MENTSSPQTKHDIELTPYQQELKERYTEAVDIVRESDGNHPAIYTAEHYVVRLKVANQQFQINLEYEEDEADWVRDMLAKALNTLIVIERNVSYGEEQ